VLFFRDQKPSLDQQVAFTRRFGPRAPTPFIKTMPDHPEVIEIIKEANEKSRFVFGGGWHSDFSFQKQPAYVTCLRAEEVPDYGGDTLYANMIAAYATLPESVRKQVDGMTALHSGDRSYSPKMQRLQDLLENMTVENTDEAEVLQTHPLVRVHPESGRRGLFISPVYTVGIQGMPMAEATAFLEGLNKHALQEANTCRFRWRDDSIAIWDNRFTQHYALSDYAEKRRHMFRTTAQGEVPIGVA
jgi:taurine dioxygenase